VKIYYSPISAVSQRSNVDKTLFTLKKHLNIIKVPWIFHDVPPATMVDLIPLQFREMISKSLKPSFFVVMDLHYSFNSYLSTNTVSATQKIWLCAEISNALSFLYQQKIVHRDLKLENILISAEGFPIISDFGFAEFVNDNGIIEFPKILGGDSSHLAPEILSSSPGKPTNYSKQPSFELGVISFEITQHAHPFPGYGPNSSITIPNFINSSMEYPQSFVDLILSLLESDPTKRMEIAQVSQIMQQLS